MYLYLLRMRILFYYRLRKNKIIDTELIEAFEYFKHNPITVFPYGFIHKYRAMELPIQTSSGFPFFLFYGKKMFFKKNWILNVKWRRKLISSQKMMNWKKL